VSSIARRLAFVAGFLALGVTSNATAEVVLRFNNWLPATHNVIIVFQEWGKAIETATAGRVKVEFTASSLGVPQRNYDLAKDGVVDVASAIHGFSAARFILPKAVELPFVGDSGEALSAAFWRVHQKYFEKANEHDDVHLLSLFTLSPGLIWTKTPVNSTQDLKGLKFRVGGGLSTEVANRLGIVVVGASAIKSYELHSTGIVDGTFLPRGSINQYKIGKFVPSGLQIPGQIYNESWFVVANLAKWKSIPAADQKIIMDLSGEKLARQQGAAWDQNDKKGDAYLAENGVTIKVAGEKLMADLRSALAPMEKEWLEQAAKRGVDGKAALEMLRSEAKKVATN